MEGILQLDTSQSFIKSSIFALDVGVLLFKQTVFAAALCEGIGEGVASVKWAILGVVVGWV